MCSPRSNCAPVFSASLRHWPSMNLSIMRLTQVTQYRDAMRYHYRSFGGFRAWHRNSLHQRGRELGGVCDISDVPAGQLNYLLAELFAQLAVDLVTRVAAGLTAHRQHDRISPCSQHGEIEVYSGILAQLSLKPVRCVARSVRVHRTIPAIRGPVHNQAICLREGPLAERRNCRLDA